MNWIDYLFLGVLSLLAFLLSNKGNRDFVLISVGAYLFGTFIKDYAFNTRDVLLWDFVHIGVELFTMAMASIMAKGLLRRIVYIFCSLNVVIVYISLGFVNSWMNEINIGLLILFTITIWVDDKEYQGRTDHDTEES